ncbi:KTSC domain-containing protein [Roseobacter sp.]|uniref:KTSC domain-containing protein n=1 Tax=Roseobacter sp. TaxID=1907202 RepID=UPI00385BA651
MLRFSFFQSLKRPAGALHGVWEKPLPEPEIEREIVHSSFLTTIGYDTTRNAIQVEYKNGCLYRIDGVPEQTYGALKKADNFDQFFREQILNQFEMTKTGTLMPMGW